MGIESIIKLLGGLGLFLFGMKIMSEGLERVAGDKMRNILAKLTNNRVAGVAVGTGVTAVIQSSSATTVMVVGFINAGLMTLMQAVGVIMGAEIGTTITAQLIALKLTTIAPIFMFAGALFMVMTKNRKLHRIGEIIAGFGILFIGIGMLGDVLKPLAEMPEIQNFMTTFQSPFIGILAGVTVTMLIQSSSASIGALQTMAISGMIPLESAVFVVLGCNIGTCITAVLASLGGNKDSKRAAIVHASFNTIGAVVFLLLLTFTPIIDVVKSISGDNASWQIANFHTLFNVTNVILMLPFAHLLVKLANKILPTKEDEEGADEKKDISNLGNMIIETPSLAVSLIKEELLRMGRLSKKNYAMATNAFFKKDYPMIQKVQRREKSIDYINQEIIHNLIKSTTVDLSENDKEIIGGYFHVVGDIERIGDHAENIAGFAIMCIDDNLQFTDAAKKELITMCDKVNEIITLSFEVFASGDANRIAEVEEVEREIDAMQVDYKQNHINRLSEEVCMPKSGVIFTDMISELERSADHAQNIARSLRGKQTDKQ